MVCLCTTDHGRPIYSPSFISGSVETLTYFTDGKGLSYDAMKSKCNARDARLCGFNEVCPQGGPHKAPAGGRQAQTDMWAPIRTSTTDASPNWVQIGTRAGGMCNKLTVYHAADLAGSWMVTNKDTPYKRIYPCCPKSESLTRG